MIYNVCVVVSCLKFSVNWDGPCFQSKVRDARQGSERSGAHGDWDWLRLRCPMVSPWFSMVVHEGSRLGQPSVVLTKFLIDIYRNIMIMIPFCSFWGELS